MRGVVATQGSKAQELGKGNAAGAREGEKRQGGKKGSGGGGKQGDEAFKGGALGRLYPAFTTKEIFTTKAQSLKERHPYDLHFRNPSPLGNFQTSWLFRFPLPTSMVSPGGVDQLGCRPHLDVPSAGAAGFEVIG